jgi:hypothetical protein
MILQLALLTLAPSFVIPVMNLLQNRQQFYFTVVYLTTNKLCICVLANLVFSQLLAAGRALKTVSSMLYQRKTTTQSALCTCHQPTAAWCPDDRQFFVVLSISVNACVFACCSVQMMLGSLRESEVELLSENMRFAITETCLALTIFREELR